MRRLIYVVLDGVGIGALPDAAEYGDEGSDTLGNISRTIPLQVPFLSRLGLGNIAPLQGVAPTADPWGFVGRLAPMSAGKDTTVGHWEQMGLVTSQPFPTYPDGFPPEVVGEFAKAIGRPILGNMAASGTEIISALGDEHVATGNPIVYTSADSVFQIAAHVDVVPLALLYSWCAIARGLLRGRHGVARVIARPFTGSRGRYMRTSDRRDFSLLPPGPTYLDMLQSHRVRVMTLGKISEIFGGRGVDSSFKVVSNEHNLSLLEEMVVGLDSRSTEGNALIMSNLVEFDTAWGHRNDVEGFARGLSAADAGLQRIAEALGPDDSLLITADHGVDPTTPSTDHSREYVPVLVYPLVQGAHHSVYEGGLADAGAFAFEYLTGSKAQLEGISFSRHMPARGWRRYTPVQPGSGGCAAGMAARVGGQEAEESSRWLAEELGDAPRLGVVLGSGLLLPEFFRISREVAFSAVPHWRDGEVDGHSYRVVTGYIDDLHCAVLQGRVHEYEGADLSEVQLPIWSLCAWGVAAVALVTASGAVAQGLDVGDIVSAEAVYDVQHAEPDKRPTMVCIPDPALVGVFRGAPSTRVGLARVESGAKMIHASVPGPQYETPSELQVLRGVGVTTVSMSVAGELRAAVEKGMRAAVLAVVTNVGDTDHSEVLRVGGKATAGLSAVLKELLAWWNEELQR